VFFFSIQLAEWAIHFLLFQREQSSNREIYPHPSFQRDKLLRTHYKSNSIDAALFGYISQLSPFNETKILLELQRKEKEEELDNHTTVTEERI